MSTRKTPTSARKYDERRHLITPEAVDRVSDRTSRHDVAAGYRELDGNRIWHFMLQVSITATAPATSF